MKKIVKFVISTIAMTMLAFFLIQPITATAQNGCFNGKSRIKSDGTHGCWLWGQECMKGNSCSLDPVALD